MKFLMNLSFYYKQYKTFDKLYNKKIYKNCFGINYDNTSFTFVFKNLIKDNIIISKLKK